MNCPPMPFIAPEYHGTPVILGMVCFCGDLEAGERVIGRLRSLAEPLADLVQPIPYPQMYPPEDPNYHPTAVGRTMFIDRIGLPEAELIHERLAASDASLRVAQLRVLGGEMARVPADSTAFAHRSSRILVNLGAFYDGPDDRPIREAWIAHFAAALRQDDPGAYVNFLAGHEPGGVRAAYPGATWDRLVAVKARYDPTNVFRLNQNVPPPD